MDNALNLLAVLILLTIPVTILWAFWPVSTWILGTIVTFFLLMGIFAWAFDRLDKMLH